MIAAATRYVDHAELMMPMAVAASSHHDGALQPQIEKAAHHSDRAAVRRGHTVLT